ncbi:MAG: hypothetical protein JOZ46_01730 [Candidatus Dormibacteraeota bacterium]|nr:hypothetical protein [Candidatus Dormibacteraeota bacterium]MBV9524516.1 hypothetical protein [Candidatus Dormibacteraeota bacterium]
MQLSFALFADSAVVPPDGKAYVLGGGFSTLALAQLPGRAAFAVVAGFRFGPLDVGQTQQVELRFVDGDGKMVLPPANLQFQSQGARLEPGQEVSISTVTFLQPMFGEPGTYTAEFWHEAVRLAGIDLHVMERPQQPAPTQPAS